MKKSIVALLIAPAIFSITIALPTCSRSPNVNFMKAQQIAVSNNTFGFDLLRKLQDPKSKDNTFVSPSSIASACTMAYFGAAGGTKTEMAQVFKIPADADSAAYALLNSDLAALNGVCQFTNANAIFVDTAFKFKAAFVDMCAKSFFAECNSVPLNSEAGIKAVNDWVAEKTNKKIPKLITSPPPDLAGILTNAVYFKGKWQAQFDKKRTVPDDFHNADGSTKKVQMMFLDGDLLGFVGDGFKVAALPYQGKRLKAYIFVPDTTSSLDKLIKSLTPENWTKWMKGISKKEEAVVQIPRFTLNYHKSLVDSLKALGMTKAFSFETADFTPMFETKKKIRIADVVHESYVQVNEEGTEAAAATAVMMQTESARYIPDKFILKADRPFLFAIADEQTGSILFLGAIQKLNSENSK